MKINSYFCVDNRKIQSKNIENLNEMVPSLMKKLLVSLFLICASDISIAQDYSFQFHIDGIQYDSLSLNGENIKEQFVKIQGKSTDGKSWSFTIPDSIYDSIVYLCLSPNSTDKEPNTVQEISLVSYINGDTIDYEGMFPFDKRITYIQAQYLETDLQEDQLFLRPGGGKEEEDIYSATLCSDKVLIPYYDNTNFAIQGHISHYYSFSNTLLPTWDTGAIEPMIQDSTKINLVIFSASWCKPCHEQIPILKEIYNDLGEYINITSISLDESKYVLDWKNLMEKEEIPWRSLLAVNDVQMIKEKYNAIAIPYILLVYTSGGLEAIDVRNSSQKEKLYHLVQR
jgi:thiol-disulfide isomerase/thioredoxin